MTIERVLLPVVGVLIAVGVVGIALLSGDKADAPSAYARLEVRGTAIVRQGSQEFTVETTRELVDGDTVTLSTGSARLLLPDGGSLELQDRAQVSVDNGPELVAGSVLVVTNGAPVTLRAAGSSLTVGAGSAARATADVAVRLDVLKGEADIGSAGRGLRVPALRSSNVPAVGLLPGQPVPLEIDPNDPWDQRYLAAAIDATQPLEDLARGFSAQVPPSVDETVAFYRQVLAGLGEQVAFEQASVGGRPPGETLLAASVALLGERGAFADRYANALAFRAEGAQWALVALDQWVPSLPVLVERIQLAAGQQPLALASAPRTTKRPAGRPTGSRAPAGTARPAAAVPGSSSPTIQVTPGPTPPPAGGGVLNPVLDPVLNLLGGLLGPLLSGAPPP